MTTERPMASMDVENLELQKFINYLRGEDALSNSMPLPASLSSNISNKLKVLSPVRALAKVSYTSQDKLDVIVNLLPLKITVFYTEMALHSQKAY